MGFLKAFRPIVLDLLATFAFLVTLWVTGNVVLATVVGIAAGLARFVTLKLRGLPVGPLQYVSVVVVIVSGAATIITNDAHFMQVKPSLIGAAVGVVMLSTNWMAPYLPPIVTDNLEPWIIRWTSRAWGLLQFVMAGINAFVALHYSRDVWSAYTAVVPTAVLVGAFALQYGGFRVLVGRAIRAKMAAGAQGAA